MSSKERETGFKKIDLSDYKSDRRRVLVDVSPFTVFIYRF